MLESPLLKKAGGGEDCPVNGMVPVEEEDCPPVKGFGDAWKLFVEEGKRDWKLVAPMTFFLLFQYGINSSTQIVAGHLSSLELSAISFSFFVMSLFALGLLAGMDSALQTLCGQAFGAGQTKMLGIYLQRAIIILTVTAVFLIPVYVFTTPILKLLGQQHDIAVVAGKFSIWMIPQLFSYALKHPMQTYLQAQSKVAILAWIALGALLIHLGFLWLFVYVFGWGFYGVVATYNISSWAFSLALLVYVAGWCRVGLSWSAFNDIWAFLKLSVSSAMMLCLLVWFQIILYLLIGHLKNATIGVAALSICMNINGWMAELLSGVSIAPSVRVANELGSGRPRAAKYAAYVTFFISLAIGFIFMVVILATRNYFPVLFTNDEQVQRAVPKLAWILALQAIAAGIHSALSGVATGAGLQVLVAGIILASFYLVGATSGVIGGYVLHWGAQGIWGGMLLGTMLESLILVVVVWRIDWKEQAARAYRRVQLWGGEQLST